MYSNAASKTMPFVELISPTLPPLNSYVEVLPSGPQNITLFGNSVVEDKST